MSEPHHYPQSANNSDRSRRNQGPDDFEGFNDINRHGLRLDWQHEGLLD